MDERLGPKLGGIRQETSSTSFSPDDATTTDHQHNRFPYHADLNAQANSAMYVDKAKAVRVRQATSSYNGP